MVKDLVKIANRLDSLGLQKEADVIDSFIHKISANRYRPQSYTPPGISYGYTMRKGLVLKRMKELRESGSLTSKIVEDLIKKEERALEKLYKIKDSFERTGRDEISISSSSFRTIGVVLETILFQQDFIEELKGIKTLLSYEEPEEEVIEEEEEFDFEKYM